MTWAINVSIVPVFRLILDVAGRDGEDLGGVTTTFRLGRFRDFVVGNRLCKALRRLNRSDCCGERGLAVIDVTDSAHVDVRLGPLEDFLCHLRASPEFAPSRSVCDRTAFDGWSSGPFVDHSSGGVLPDHLQSGSGWERTI